MRCEICGVPVEGDNRRCERCQSRSSNPARPAVAGRTLGFGEKHPRHSPNDDIDLPPEEMLKEARSSVRESSATPVVLENKYRLLNELGRGAMGTVFLAEDISLRRQVAIKFLLPELDTSAECAIRFKQEAVGMASVRHHNVAQIYSYAEHGGTLYFVMEYLDGESLENLIDSHNRRGFFVPLEDAVDILFQAVTGLAAIHQAGVVHRDIKPGNIMLTDEGRRAVIMDFGLVRSVRIEQEVRNLAGTPAYIAPEIAEGRPGCDRSIQADIYSMGVTAYELLTGSLPFSGRTWVEIVRKHISEVPPFPSERRPGLPEQIDELIFRMLSKEPHERYSDCMEVLEDLYVVERLALPDVEGRTLSSWTRTTGKWRHPSRTPSFYPSSSKYSGAFRSTPPSSSRGRLLVVDPDPEFRTKVHEIAKATVPGCRVYSATDGEMALKMVDEIHPNAVILELSLPEINGLELTATLRGDATFDNTAIIIVSSTGGKRETEILSRLRIACFLAKPVDPDALADHLRPILERPISLSRFSTAKRTKPQF